MAKLSLAPFVMLLMLSIMTGCKPALPTTVPELGKVISDARDEADQARQDKAPKKAAAAADLADRALAQLNKIYKSIKAPSDQDKQIHQSAVLAAQKARHFADLADEEKQLADAIKSWKAKGYRAARSLAWKGVFKGLALAAEQAGKQTDGQDLEALSPKIQESAELATRLAHELAGRQPLPDGNPDWPGIAMDMNTFASADPPAKHSMFLALAFLVVGRNDFALIEIESIKPEDLPPGDTAIQFQLLQAMIYSMNNWQHLAVLKVDQVSGQKNTELEDSEALLAGAHLVLSFFYLKEKDYKAADRELVRAMQIWPNNPVSVFLTGERLAASGEYEKAAKSLEDLASNADQKWFADRIAQRAREVRDQKAEGQSLIHDTSFMSRLALEFLSDAAAKSENGRKVKQMVDNAQAFGDRILGYLPGGNADETEVQEEASGKTPEETK